MAWGSRGALALGAAVAMGWTAGTAEAGVLYSAFAEPNGNLRQSGSEIAGGKRVAQGIVPSQGTAGVALVDAATFFQQSATLELTIRRDAAGRPSKDVLVRGTQSYGDSSERRCITLDRQVFFDGTSRYWAAVGSAGGTIFWTEWNGNGRPVATSDDSGATWNAAFTGLTYGLSLETATSCEPDVFASVAPNLLISTRDHTDDDRTAWREVRFGNSGRKPLTITGVSFSGGDADRFRALLDAPTTPGARPFAPLTIEPEAATTVPVVVACDPGAVNTIRTTTVTVTTNDPDEPSFTWPARCLVDREAPGFRFTPTAPDGAGGWYRSAASVAVEAADRLSPPEFFLRCTDSLGGTYDFTAAGDRGTVPVSGEGRHVLTCTARDSAFRPNSGSGTTTIGIDATPPRTEVDPPPALLASRRAEVVFRAVDALSGDGGGRCSVDGGRAVPCTSPFAAEDLADGPHRIEVTGVDVAGNADATPEAVELVVDATAPETTAGPAVVSGGRAELPFGATDAGSGVAGAECRVDDGEWSACTSPFVADGLAPGARRLEVRGRDVAGNSDATPAVADVTIAAPSVATTGSAFTASGGPAVAVRDRTVPRLSELKLVRGRLRVRLSEAARVTVVLQRRVRGRWRAVARTTRTTTQRAGLRRLVVTRSRRPGTYRLAVAATDAAGNTGRAVLRLARRT